MSLIRQVGSRLTEPHRRAQEWALTRNQVAMGVRGHQCPFISVLTRVRYKLVGIWIPSVDKCGFTGKPDARTLSSIPYSHQTESLERNPSTGHFGSWLLNCRRPSDTEGAKPGHDGTHTTTHGAIVLPQLCTFLGTQPRHAEDEIALETSPHTDSLTELFSVRNEKGTVI